MEPDFLAFLCWGLNHIRPRKRIGMGIDHFLIKATRFRSADIAAHFTNNVLVKVAHKAFNDHQGFMGNRRPNSLLKVPAVE